MKLQTELCVADRQHGSGHQTIPLTNDSPLAAKLSLDMLAGQPRPQVRRIEERTIPVSQEHPALPKPFPPLHPPRRQLLRIGGWQI